MSGCNGYATDVRAAYLFPGTQLASQVVRGFDYEAACWGIGTYR
jgi:hypothetical protein